MTSGGPKEVKEMVLDRQLCTACGMCVGLCPYIQERAEHIAFVAECSRSEGRCYSVCPRTEVDLPLLRSFLADAPYHDPLLGQYTSLGMSRSTQASLRRKGQYGATVTALLCHALESGIIDGALLTTWAGQEASLLAVPILATSREEILKAAGSKYTASPSLKLLNLPSPNVHRLAVVGRPCQLLAIRKRQCINDATFPSEKIVLLMGLFCMWTLSYRDVERYVRPLVGSRTITKMDIPKGRCRVTCGSTHIELSHDAIRGFSLKTCQRCMDFTAECADISVGSTEWKTGWNTLIVRSAVGSRLVDSARSSGCVETRPMNEDRIRILREASRIKKQKALASLEADALQDGRRPYLILEEAEKAAIRDG